MVWDIAYFPAAVAAGAGNGVPAGVFIPVANLPGILTAELSEPAKEQKVAYSIASRIFSVVSQSTRLGLAVTRAQTSPNVDRLNQAFTLTTTFSFSHEFQVATVLPLPTGDAGKLALTDLFAGAAIVAAEGAVAGAGVVIPNALIQANGGIPALAAGTDDCRGWIVSLYQSMFTGLSPAAALVSIIRGIVSGLTPPANFTGAGAITGLTLEDLPKRSFFTLTYTLTMQIALNQDTQTFDLVV